MHRRRSEPEPLPQIPVSNTASQIRFPPQFRQPVGQSIFVTQADVAEKRRTLMCLDRADGRLLWQAGALYEATEPTHPTNPFCSASPVTDGQRVIAWFGSAGVYCYDFEGQELWRRDLGLQEHEWGYAASPVIHGELCFLNFGPGKHEFVIALNKNTGEVVWKFDVPRPAPTPQADGEKPALDPDVCRGSWSTPLVIRAGERDELIVVLPERVIAFEPETGRTLWTCDGLGLLIYSSPMWGDGLVVAMSNYGRVALAVKPGGSGDVTATHRAWQLLENKQWLGSGVIHKGRIYIDDESGIARSLDLATGKAVWEKRLPAARGNGSGWSSAVLTADERLYIFNRSGDTFVLRANPEFELLATNSLGEPTNASPVISDGEIFVRTNQHLWCVCSGRP